MDIDKLETITVDLSKLSNEVKNLAKKTVYDKLAKKLVLFRLLIILI